MDTVQLAPLNIGSSVLIKTTSMAECTGIYEGYLEEERSIWLNDAKWYGAGTEEAPSNYDSLILPLDSIAHIEGIQRETAAASNSASSLIKVSDVQKTETTSASSAALNGFAERKVQLKRNIATNNSSKMQEFCKQLFSNCNFAHLLQMQATKNETKFCIKLPSYYASFFRQPKWCFETTQPPFETNQSLAVIKPDLTAAIDMGLANNLKNLKLNASEDGAGDSEQQNPYEIDKAKCMNLNLCSKISNLNLNGKFDNKLDAPFEAVEVDLSNLQASNSYAQIKIGNLYFKPSTQVKNLLTQESMQEN